VPLAVAVAAELFARISGKPGLVNRGKIAELYHQDWVCRTSGLDVSDPVTFATGFPDAIAWYRQAGWLPRGAGPDTTSRNEDDTRSL
jgi:hypothetical protein